MFLRFSDPKKAIPRPRVNAKTSEAMTSTMGGMEMVKKGSTFSKPAISVTADDFSISDGKTEIPVKYDRKPEKTVSQYAISAVIARRTPAPRPMSAMAGVTRPIIIRGIRNWRKFPNIPLNVANTRIAPMGRKLPRISPRAMAVNIRGSSPNLNFFNATESFVSMSDAKLIFYAIFYD